jgi:hypothetical protein
MELAGCRRSLDDLTTRNPKHARTPALVTVVVEDHHLKTS